MKIEKSEKIFNWFVDLNDEQQILAEALREVVLATNSNFKEELKWKMPNYSLNKLVCYLQKSKSHVTIGFQQGAHLDDPNGWLLGTGKDMRHIKFALSEKIDTEKVKFLVEQAIKYDQ